MDLKIIRKVWTYRSTAKIIRNHFWTINLILQLFISSLSVEVESKKLYDDCGHSKGTLDKLLARDQAAIAAATAGSGGTGARRLQDLGFTNFGVVNGDNLRPHSSPWQVSLYIQYPDRVPRNTSCGGVLIHPQWVLTAAHCFSTNREPALSSALWQVQSGEVHQQGLGPSVQTSYVQEIFCKEGYNFTMDPDMNLNFLGGIQINDIALVKLREPIAVTQEVRPICLPPAGKEYRPGKKCYLVDWAEPQRDEWQSVDFNSIQLTMTDNGVCERQWNLSLRNSFLCAGDPLGIQGTCEGSSGRSLTCYTREDDEEDEPLADRGNPFTLLDDNVQDARASVPTRGWTAAGILVVGERGVCASTLPHIFTKVSAYTEWIHHVFDNHLKPDFINPCHRDNY